MSKPAVTSSVLEDGRVFWWAAVDVAVLRDRELSPWAKVIYAVLCTYADRTRVCFPSVATLCSDAGMSERQARYALKELEKSGYVEKRPQFREDGGQGANLYRIVGHCRVGEGVAEGGCIPRRGGGAHPADITRTKKELDPKDKESLSSREAAMPPVGAEKISGESEEKDTVEGWVPEDPEDIASAAPASGDGDEPGKETADLSGVPAAMREAAEFLALKTGRPLRETDIPYLEILEARHVPARVLKAVNEAVERFRRLGRDPASLDWKYVWEMLRRVPDTRAPKRRGDPKMSPEHRAHLDRKFDEVAAAWPRQERLGLARRAFYLLFPEGDAENERRWETLVLWIVTALEGEKKFLPALDRFLEGVDLLRGPRADPVPGTAPMFVPCGESDSG